MQYLVHRQSCSGFPHMLQMKDMGMALQLYYSTARKAPLLDKRIFTRLRQRKDNRAMELRKDPVTQSWMLVGDEQDGFLAEEGPCGFCPGGKFAAGSPIYSSPGG